MSQPLPHYWIFTGHNSYLTGNQLSSDSSDQPITSALQRGVRVVELDLWPDDQGGIKVTHGKYVFSPSDHLGSLGFDFPGLNCSVWYRTQWSWQWLFEMLCYG
jgi:hypothetical protein